MRSDDCMRKLQWWDFWPKTSFKWGVRSGLVDGIHIMEIQIKYSNSQSFASRVKAFLLYLLFGIYIVLTRKADLVVCSSTPLTVGLIGVFGKIFRRRKFVFEVRDLWPEFPIQMGIISNPILIALLRRMEWIIHRHADVGIALSEGCISNEHLVSSWLSYSHCTKRM